MSNQTVIYLSDQELKTWLKTKSQQEGLSLSRVITNLLQQAKSQTTKPVTNPFLDLPDLTDDETKQWEKSLKQVQKSRNAKPDSYYKNIFE
jgi:hypothetical protein